jgi:hypothetical protein
MGCGVSFWPVSKDARESGIPEGFAYSNRMEINSVIGRKIENA